MYGGKGHSFSTANTSGLHILFGIIPQFHTSLLGGGKKLEVLSLAKSLAAPFQSAVSENSNT